MVPYGKDPRKFMMVWFFATVHSSDMIVHSIMSHDDLKSLKYSPRDFISFYKKYPLRMGVNDHHIPLPVGLFLGTCFCTLAYVFQIPLQNYTPLHPQTFLHGPHGLLFLTTPLKLSQFHPWTLLSCFHKPLLCCTTRIKYIVPIYFYRPCP